MTSPPFPTRTMLYQRAMRVMPGGVSSPVRSLRAVEDEPLFIRRGSGATLIDSDGVTLVDYIGSWGAAIAGHAHPAVVEAVERTIRDGLSFGATTRLEVELAETIVARVPGIEQVRFVCSGTEAVMSAVRLARAATGRDKIVKFEGGYHGHADTLLVAAGSGAATVGVPDSSGVPHSVAQDTIVLPYNDVEALQGLFALGGDDIAGVIVEPVAGNMGVVPATPEFLTALRSLTRHHGSLLIFDEVVTGFRVASGGAQELTGVQADLIALGKVMGGGLPVAAYAGPASLMKLIAPVGPVYQAGTLAGNPAGMAAGLAVLQLLDRAAYVRLEELGERLQSGLSSVLTQSGHRASVQRVGSMLSVFFGAERVTNYREAGKADHITFGGFFRGMRRAGVLVPPSGYESWFLSLAHGPAEVDATVRAAAGVLDTLSTGSASRVHSTVAAAADRQPSVANRTSGRRERVYRDVFEMLPDAENPTPLVRINRLNPAANFTLYAKLEWMNPFGSVKDRAAWSMLRDMEARGEIGPQAPGRGLVEPTSGNTGISLAAMASVRDLKLRAVVPNRVPLEKKLLLRICGADVEVINDALCPMPGLGDGSINIARSHARAQPDRYAMPNQYINRANVEAHQRTTAPEIWRQTAGSVTHVFVSLGTCGTATGLALALRERNPRIRIVAVQPDEGHDVPGLRSMAQLSATALFDADLMDEIIEIDHRLAWQQTLALVRTEGLMAGPSSGLILQGARQVLQREPGLAGVGVMIFPDSVFKYTAGLLQHFPDLATGTSLLDTSPSTPR